MFKIKFSHLPIIIVASFSVLIIAALAYRELLFQPAKINVYDLIHKKTAPDIKWPSDTIRSAGLLNCYYKDSAKNNLWTGREPEQEHNRIMLLQMLSFADSLGLNAKEYHVGYIKTYDSLLHYPNFRESGQRAENELVFTDAALSFLFDAAYGKEIDISYSGIKYNIDSAGIVNMFGHLLIHRNWRKTLDSLQPDSYQFEALKNAHNRIKAFVPEFPPIESIDTSDNFAIKRHAVLKLQAYGLIDQTAGNDSVSDSSFNSALKNFQKMMNTDTTGTLNKETLEALNFPLAKRLEEIKRSLNFWRWAARLQEQQFVFVNVAGACLEVVDNGSKQIEMRVIAGQPDKQTPLFAAYITNVTTYPHWVLPRSIAIKETLPRIIKNINFLAKNNMEVMDYKGNILDPYKINWRKYSKNNFPFIIRQATGCDDALGVLKFDLSSPYDIYLHDTNAKHLFSRNNRFLSHGCIRLEKPVEFAKYLLGSRFDSVSEKYLSKCMKNQEPGNIRVKKRVPIVIFYLTTTINQNGELQFYKDVYGLEDIN